MKSLKSQLQARDEKRAKEMLQYHGCYSGDCPHEKQTECYDYLVKDVAESYHEIIETLANIAQDAKEVLQAVIGVDENWSVEQERRSNKAICIPAIRRIESAQSKLDALLKEGG